LRHAEKESALGDHERHRLTRMDTVVADVKVSGHGSDVRASGQVLQAGEQVGDESLPALEDEAVPHDGKLAVAHPVGSARELVGALDDAAPFSDVEGCRRSAAIGERTEPSLAVLDDDVDGWFGHVK